MFRISTIPLLTTTEGRKTTTQKTTEMQIMKEETTQQGPIINEEEIIVDKKVLTQLPSSINGLQVTLVTTLPPPRWVKSLKNSIEEYNFGSTLVDDMSNRQSNYEGLASKAESQEVPINLRPYINQINKERIRSSSNVENNGVNVQTIDGDVAIVEIVDYPETDESIIRRPSLPSESSKEENKEIMETDKKDKKKTQMSFSKTKVVTTIEKRKFVGPCGSACSYSGNSYLAIID